MNTTVIAADFDPAHCARAHSFVCAAFVAAFVVVGAVLVARALRLVRRSHQPHATRYAHPAQ